MKKLLAFTLLCASTAFADTNLTLINVGSSANDGSGDTLRDAFIKVNANTLAIPDREVLSFQQAMAGMLSWTNFLGYPDYPKDSFRKSGSWYNTYYTQSPGWNVNAVVVSDVCKTFAAGKAFAPQWEWIDINAGWSCSNWVGTANEPGAYARGHTSEGILVPSPDRFPAGMKASVDLIHSYGLKAMLYFRLGEVDESGHYALGSNVYGNITNFILTWGFDGLEGGGIIDGSGDRAKSIKQCMEVAKAIQDCGKKVLVNWNYIGVGYDTPQEQGLQKVFVQNYKVIGGDHIDGYSAADRITNAPYCAGEVDVASRYLGSSGWYGPGRRMTPPLRPQYDPSMLPNMPVWQYMQKYHTVNTIFGAPVWGVDADLCGTTGTWNTNNPILLLNPYVNAVQLDKGGLMARLVNRTITSTVTNDIFVRDLEEEYGMRKAIAVINYRTNSPSYDSGFTVVQAGMRSNVVYQVFDCWGKTNVGTMTNTFTNTLAGGTARLYVMYPIYDDYEPKTVPLAANTYVNPLAIEGVSNLVVNFDRTYTQIYATNAMTLTNFIGMENDKAKVATIRITPVTASRMLTWPTFGAASYGVQMYTNTAVKTVQTNMTLNTNFIIRLTSFGTNIHVDVTEWK